MDPKSNYSIAIVAVFDVEPPIVRLIGTVLPDGAVGGIWIFTWYSPTKPGASPEKEIRDGLSG